MILLKLLFFVVVQAGSSDHRIINGEPARENQFPFHVAVLFGGDIVCGGSLLDEYHVLTASHCLRDFTAHVSRDILPEDLAVVAGTADLRAATEIRQVDTWFSHAQWKNFDKDSFYDIAVLRLTAPFSESSSITPIHLPSGSSNATLGVVMGYGLQREEHTRFRNGLGEWIQFESRTNQLLWAEVPIEPGCVDSSGRPLVCAGGGSNQTGTCSGDSGGPLVVISDTNPIQIGVVSVGYPTSSDNSWVKCDSSRPGRFAPVAYHLQWIYCVMDRSRRDCLNVHVPNRFPWQHRYKPSKIRSRQSNVPSWSGTWSFQGCNIEFCECCPTDSTRITDDFGVVEIDFGPVNGTACDPFPILRFPSQLDTVIFDWNNKTWVLTRDRSYSIFVQDRNQASDGACNLWLQCASGNCVPVEPATDGWMIAVLVLIGLSVIALLIAIVVACVGFRRRRALADVEHARAVVPEPPSENQDERRHPVPKWIEMKQMDAKRKMQETVVGNTADTDQVE